MGLRNLLARVPGAGESGHHSGSSREPWVVCEQRADLCGSEEDRLGGRKLGAWK